MAPTKRLSSLLAKACSLHELRELLRGAAPLRLDAAAATAALHRFGLLGGRSSEVPASLRSALLERGVDGLKSAQLAQQAWALGRLGGPLARDLLPRIAARAEEPPAVASVAWAVAKLHAGAPAAPGAQGCIFPGEAAARCVAEMRPQDASNTLWAASTVRCMPPLQVRLCAAAVVVAWSPRDCATALWAYAAARCHPALGTQEALVAAASAGVRAAGGQDLSNTLWALATLRVEAKGYIEEAPLQQLRGLRGQSATNAMWALATLHLPNRLSILAEAACSAGQCLRPQELANGVWALAAGGVHHAAFFALARSRFLAAGEELGTLLGLQLLANVCWAFSLASKLLGRPADADDQRLLLALRSAMLSHGAVLDTRALQLRTKELKHTRQNETKDEAAEEETYLDEATALERSAAQFPRLLHRGGGVAVIYKPSGWEVDGTSAASAPRLSAFVRSRLWKTSLTVRDVTCDHGFLHRLDTPSSGLVLHAETYQALQCLRWQQDTHSVDREYIALVHGDVWAAAELAFPLVELRGGSAVALGGRPSLTRVRPLARLLRQPGLAEEGVAAGTAYTLLAVSILTGRKHQIRTHLREAGHSVVCDPRYGRPRLKSDLAWCPRNFLHRYRLTFEDVEGCRRDIIEPMPPDLQEALSSLRAASAEDARSLREWLRWPRPFCQP